MTDIYRDDLAYIHDVGFGRFAQAAAAMLPEVLRASGVDRGLVIDLGCGSGILTGELSSAGYDVLGIDISDAMIALARKRVPAGQFRVESFLTAQFPPCVAVTAIGEVFSYLFDGSNSRQELSKLFRRIHDALLPGGILVFDVVGPGRYPGGGVRQLFREGEGWAVLVTVEEDRRRKLLTRRITSFRKVEELYRRDHEVHQQRVFTRPELTTPLRRIGFRVRRLSGYGSQRFVAGHLGFLARRP